LKTFLIKKENSFSHDWGTYREYFCEFVELLSPVKMEVFLFIMDLTAMTQKKRTRRNESEVEIKKEEVPSQQTAKKRISNGRGEVISGRLEAISRFL
jgi:hypothetical protein